ncbi:MAG TPA: hypothetical protein PKO41_09165 [Dokdonella sp.]|uniref:hypothetical protein n=1 Tax=Dokdonella sp. TaxID=2291710 RepID=UPI0025B7C898|nr:hypothetical protein [Dokdonella sp.]MBX3692312.1 hypothetical protein [Dokdonella sp.]MCW5567805.1 hypothetical protein [Dokdonella sp.]HNR92581.1 hypothetical protein [Dokdonella sp.]
MLHVQFRPRHPLARLLAGVLALLALAAVIALGVFALAALIVGGLLWWGINAVRRTFGAPPAPVQSATSEVIDGEFTVVQVRPQRPSR